MRKQSNTYGKYFSMNCLKTTNLYLFQKALRWLFNLSEEAIVHYNVDNYYNSKYEDGISYRDSHLNINWGVDNTKLIISEKGYKFKRLSMVDSINILVTGAGGQLGSSISIFQKVDYNFHFKSKQELILGIFQL